MLVDDLRLAVMRLSRRARLERDERDVSDAQSAVLFVLQREGPRTLADLAKHERVSSPSMYRTVQSMQNAGLVERHPHHADRRKILVELTDTGVLYLEHVRKRRSAWFLRQFEGLTEAERAALAAATPILQKMADG